MSYGAICAAGTKLQQVAGIDDSPRSLHEDILAATRGQTDTDAARHLADHAAPTIDWLAEEHDVVLTVETSWTGLGHRQPRLHAPPNRSGETLLSMLLSACERSGAQLLTEALVTTLYVDDACRVLGVGVERPDGRTETLGCDAIILATCGFGANRRLVREFIPELSNAHYHGHEGNSGDGILWGIELGGSVADMGSYQALGSLATPQAMVMPHTLLIGGGVQVNRDGRRFQNELDDISGQALTILTQPGGICWMVFDRRLHDQAMATFQEYRDADEINTAKHADSWERLAEKTGMPPAALTATMADTTRRCETEEPDRFGRRFARSDRLHPPFFAIRVTGALFHTQGGLVVDTEARVRREQGGLLPNLFAGGGAARAVSGPGGWGYLPGMGLCTAVTLGRLAGHAAAALSGDKP